ncbi:hypothetical protein BD289DRAFT_379857 [Coniella lustricola]|uniref:HD/PDEase domain-containing protein n=1 Tax=Coniella lustricola TaxID=2025994 RepID=A0A2T2ZS55_9PEZI|nr:hypothetical protein BD289DRAFT_379857 [Coniella lustricola]
MADSTSALITSVEAYVKDYMSHYDASHDWKHIQRVLHLAKQILASQEQSASASSPSSPSTSYDHTLVILGSLLHDVGDKKYLEPGQDAMTLVRDVLLARGADAQLAARVQELALHVSFSSEIQDPARVRKVIERLPELAIVQDADRLDAIGAVGIGRCFAFTGAKGRKGTGDGSGKGEGLDGSIEHFKEKLELLQDMMKTETGRKMAVERTERLRVFRQWWESEVEGV